jgi:hypothetical protein
VTSTYGQICGVLFGGSEGNTVRCYARGHKRYGGRCQLHEQLGEECRKSRRPPTCGFRGRTFSGMPCNAQVHCDGDRCARHDREGLANAALRRRAELEDRIAHFETQRARYDEKLATLRAELANLASETREAAE